MLSVAELQFQPEGWGKIAYNPTEGERWAERSSLSGNKNAAQSLREIRLTKEIVQQKTEQIHRKILNDRFASDNIEEPFVGPKKIAKSLMKLKKKLAAAGYTPRDVIWREAVANAMRRRDRQLLRETSEQYMIESNSDPADSSIYYETPVLQFPLNMQAPASLDGMQRAMKAALDGHLQHTAYDTVPRPLVELFSAVDEAPLENHSPMVEHDGVFVQAQYMPKMSAAEIMRAQREGLAPAAVDPSAQTAAGALAGPVLLPPAPLSAPALPLPAIMERYPAIVAAYGVRALAGKTRAQLDELADVLRANNDDDDAAAEGADADETSGLRFTPREKDRIAEAERLEEKIMALPEVRARFARFDEQTGRSALGDDEARSRRAEAREAMRWEILRAMLTDDEMRLVLTKPIAETAVYLEATIAEENALDEDENSTLLDQMAPLDHIEREYTLRWPYAETGESAQNEFRNTLGDSADRHEMDLTVYDERFAPTEDIDVMQGSVADEDAFAGGINGGAIDPNADVMTRASMASRAGANGVGTRAEWRKRVASAANERANAAVTGSAAAGPAEVI